MDDDVGRWTLVAYEDPHARGHRRRPDLARDLLAEQSLERAGVAPGTLYGRVDSKELLFLALHDRELDRITGDGVAALDDDAAWSRLQGADLVDAVVSLLGRHYAEEGRLLRVFILRAAVDDRVREESGHGRGRLEDAVVARLLASAASYPHPDVPATVRATARIVLDSMSWRTAFGVDVHLVDPEPREAWIARLQGLARTYLLTPPG